MRSLKKLLICLVACLLFCDLESIAQNRKNSNADSKDDTTRTLKRLKAKAVTAVNAFKKRAESGDVASEAVPHLQSFGGLMEAKRYRKAEETIDKALIALDIDPTKITADTKVAEQKGKKPAPQKKNPGGLPDFDPTGFSRIFDGKTLTNWDGDPKYWSVQNGVLTGTVTPKTLLKKNSWIVWRGSQVKDFELVLDYRVSAQGNSGVGYRLATLKDDPFSVRGPQADIHGLNMFTGICYEENGRRLLAGRGQSTWIKTGKLPRLIAQVNGPEELQSVIRKEDWNRYRLVVRGNHAAHYINGIMMSEIHDHDQANRMKQGLIGVQVHVGPPMKIEYRNLYLRHFGASPKGKATRGHVEYESGKLLERDHGPTFQNLVSQTAKNSGPITTRKIGNQDPLVIETENLSIVRSGLSGLKLSGGSKPLGDQNRGFDLVVQSDNQVIRVPGAGKKLIGKSLDRKYRVVLKFNPMEKRYELESLNELPSTKASDRLKKK